MLHPPSLSVTAIIQIPGSAVKTAGVESVKMPKKLGSESVKQTIPGPGNWDF